jgi:sugar lactone lactonase YvrE
VIQSQRFRMSLAAVAAVACGVAYAAKAPLGDVTIDDSNVYPESISSTADGTLFSGSVKGIIYRATPGSARAAEWVRPDAQNGLLSVFGVLADERSGTLWVCSTPSSLRSPPSVGTSSLVAFDLRSGRFKSAYPLPAPASVCNDIAIDRSGAAFASDTQNGRILKLPRGAKALEVFADDALLKGIDGLVFDSDGTLYVNIVTKGLLLRVARGPDGSAGAITQLMTSEALRGPDGFRLIRKHTFMLAEGNGARIDEATITGDRATIRVLREGLNSPTAVTLIGNTVYCNEGKIGYLIDPKLEGQDPGTFVLHAVPLADGR